MVALPSAVKLTSAMTWQGSVGFSCAPSAVQHNRLDVYDCIRQCSRLPCAFHRANQLAGSRVTGRTVQQGCAHKGCAALAMLLYICAMLVLIEMLHYVDQLIFN